MRTIPGYIGIAATLLMAASAHASKPLEMDSTHYHLWTSASASRGSQALGAAEILHRSWTAWAGTSHGKRRHNLRLFASRSEMRRALPGLGWAEAIYHDDLCDQYDDPHAERPWHWLVHEGTHQLAAEDARLHLPRWANEGLACLFSASRTRNKSLVLGSVDAETYPVWWLRRKPLAGTLQQDLARGNLVLPSRILSEPDTLDISSSVNAHYLTWWSMAHFFHTTDSVAWRNWVFHDGSKAGLLRRYGPAATLDARWYKHVLGLRDSVSPPKR
jgi:hypothetical protein